MWNREHWEENERTARGVSISQAWTPDARIMFPERDAMKQQCHISFIYVSWIILVGGFIYYILRGSYLQAGSWVFFIALFLWLYVRYFPSISRYMGYGSVEDELAEKVNRTAASVTLYTGLGCPFCPLVRERLKQLQAGMGFELSEIDVTLKPDLLISKSIRALPVIETGAGRLVGNATSKQLAEFITEQTASVQKNSPT